MVKIYNRLSEEQQQIILDSIEGPIKKSLHRIFSYYQAHAGICAWNNLTNIPDKSSICSQIIPAVTSNSKNEYWSYAYSYRDSNNNDLLPIPKELLDILKETFIGELEHHRSKIDDYDSLLINLYPRNKSLNWHQDVTEDYRCKKYPIISVSLGCGIFSYADTPLGYIGNPENKYDVSKINLESGYCLLIGGKHRYCSHSIVNTDNEQYSEKLKQFNLDIVRINLTLRKVII